MYLLNFAALTSISTPSITDEYVISGYYSFGDGGGGNFVWKTIAPLAILPYNDKGIIFHHDTLTNGYFLRSFRGVVNINWFGALGDDSIDVTSIVQHAILSPYIMNGTVYFPKGTYVGAFEFLHTTGEINLIGDGQGTVLKSNGSVNGSVANPVLRLGYRSPDWRKAKVSNLVIDGWSYNFGAFPNQDRFSDGVIFDDNTSPQKSGCWVFEKVTFQNCNRAVYKPFGNLGNSYTECLWVSNNYGYWAQGYNVSQHWMHAGCDRFIGGEMHSNDYAAIYYTDSVGGGVQIILDGIIIEGNPGFGLFVKFSGLARMTAFAISIRNVWFEENGGKGSGSDWLNYQVTIDGVTYDGKDMYFEGVRSVGIVDGLVNRIKLVESSVNMNNCSSDNAALGYSIEVDDLSAIVANELRYIYQPSDQIFVNSISYDGTGDISGDPAPPTSVWGPLRTVNQYGTDNIKISQRFYNSGPRHFSAVIGYDRGGGVLKDGCIAIDVPATATLRSDDDFWFIGPDGVMPDDSYYVW
jgi:hypothetical protein